MSFISTPYMNWLHCPSDRILFGQALRDFDVFQRAITLWMSIEHPELARGYKKNSVQGVCNKKITSPKNLELVNSTDNNTGCPNVSHISKNQRNVFQKRKK